MEKKILVKDLIETLSKIDQKLEVAVGYTYDGPDAHCDMMADFDGIILYKGRLILMAKDNGKSMTSWLQEK